MGDEENLQEKYREGVDHDHMLWHRDFFVGNEKLLV